MEENMKIALASKREVRRVMEAMAEGAEVLGLKVLGLKVLGLKVQKTRCYC